MQPRARAGTRVVAGTRVRDRHHRMPLILVVTGVLLTGIPFFAQGLISEKYYPITVGMFFVGIWLIWESIPYETRRSIRLNPSHPGIIMAKPPSPHHKSKSMD